MIVSFAIQPQSNLSACQRYICDLKITRLDSPATPASRGDRPRPDRAICMRDVFGSTGSATRLLFKAVGSEVAMGSPPSFLPFPSPFPAANRPLFIQIDSIGHPSTTPVPAEEGRDQRTACRVTQSKLGASTLGRTTRASTLQLYGPGPRTYRLLGLVW